MTLSIVLLNAHALRLQARSNSMPWNFTSTRSVMGAWLILAGVGAPSVTLALLTPPTPWSWPGLACMLLPVVLPMLGACTNRTSRRLLAGRAGSAGPPGG
jgi:hypothetical protein